MSNSTLITLNGYQFPYNPTKLKRTSPRAIAYQETISGGFLTDYGLIATDRTWDMGWDIMDSTFYNELYTLYSASSVSYTLVDDYANTYTVSMLNLEYGTEVPGGVQAYADVELKLQVTAGTP